MTFVQLRSVQQAQLNKVSKELLEIKDSTSVLRKRLAEMMNSLLSDLVSDSALQAATILVAMASGKTIWRPKFRRKSPIGDQQIKRETCLKNYQ